MPSSWTASVALSSCVGEIDDELGYLAAAEQASNGSLSIELGTEELLRNGVTDAVPGRQRLGTAQSRLVGAGRGTRQKDRTVPIELHETHSDAVQPLDRGEGDEAVRSCDDDTVDRAVGTTKAVRGHALLDRRRRAHVVRRYRPRAVRNDEVPAINADAGVVAG